MFFRYYVTMSNTIVIVLAILTSLQLCVADMTETEECIFVPLRERVDCGFDNIPMWMCEQLRDPGTNQPCCFDDGNYVGFNSLPHCFYPLQQTSVPTPTPYQPPPPNRQTSNSVQTIAAPAPTAAAVEATTLGFAPTAGLLGNTPPTGAINPFGTPPQQQRPRPNPLAAFGGQRPISLAPLTVTRATTQATNNNLPTTVRPTVERPRNLQNLLTQLGIEVDGGIPAAGQVSPGTGVLGTNVRPQTNPQPNPQPATPSKIFTQDEKNLAFCTFYKTGQLPKGLESFFEIEICDEINATATPAFANEVMQAEINRLLGQVGARPTQATSAVGASNPFAQGGNTAGQTNPLGGLLGGGNTAGLASLLGGGSTGLGGGNAGLASLLGGGGNAGLASLLGGGGSSGLSSLLGGGSSSGLSSLLGGGNSGLSSLLGGGNSGLSSLLGGGNSGLSSLLGGGNSGLSSLLGGGNSGLSSLLGGGNSGLSSLLGGGNSGLSSLLGGGNSGLSSLLGGGSSGLSSLLGGGGGGLASLLGGSSQNAQGSSSTSSLLSSLLLSQGLQGRPNQQASPVIGDLQPDFLGTPAPPQYNPVMCQLLSGLDIGGSGSTFGTLFRSQFLQQYGCFQGILSNPLLLLSGGGINTIRDQLGPLLGITSSTSEESTGDQATGALDPARIPYSVMLECLEKRTEYNRQFNCKVGVHVNLRTEQECLNIGCVFASGGMCFRCPLIKKESELNHPIAKTCAVEKSDRQECPGFQNTYLLSTLFSQNSFQARSGSVPASSGSSSSAPRSSSSSSGGLAPRAGIPAVRQFGNLLGGLGGLGGLTGGLGGLGGLTGGLGGLGGLTGGLGGLGGLTGGLGGLGGLTGGLGGLGGIGGGFTNTFLKNECEKKGCCWDSDSNVFSAVRGACYEKEYPADSGTDIDCLADITCGDSRDGILARIIGGTVATTNTDRPWQVLIRFRGSNTVRCSGTIICSQWIVTSSSCLDRIQDLSSPLGFSVDLNPSSLEVIAGTNDPFNPLLAGESLDIQRIISHPYYVTTQFTSDLALLQVPLLTFMQDNIQPVCVPKFLAQPLPVDTEIFVTGYGKTAGGASMSLLKEIKLKVSSYTECLSTYESTLPVSGVFCATPVITGEDTCIGDGGSPALTYDTTTNKFTIVGINVGGSNDCSGLKPLVFIDITIYREWLRKTSNGCCDLLGSRLG